MNVERLTEVQCEEVSYDYVPTAQDLAEAMSNQLTISDANAQILSGFDLLSKSDKKVAQSIKVQDVVDSLCDNWRNSFTPLVNNPKRRIVQMVYYTSGVMFFLREADYGKCIPDRGLDSPGFAYLKR